MNKNKLNRLDEMMQSQVDSGMIPGGHLRIIKDGERVYDKCFGMADVARNLKVSDNTIYRLYSMTKPITAVATMILYDRGLIDLSDNVSWFLEGFKDQKVETKDGIVPANRDVKIIDLLTMTAGLMYPDRNVNPSGDKMADLFDKFYERAEGTKAKLAEKCPDCVVTVEDLADKAKLEEEIKTCDILINTTIMGMKPHEDVTLVDKSLFRKDLVVADTVYNPEKTKMILEAEEAGCKAIGGAGMLLQQGAVNYELFVGKEMPLAEYQEFQKAQAK